MYEKLLSFKTRLLRTIKLYVKNCKYQICYKSNLLCVAHIMVRVSTNVEHLREHCRPYTFQMLAAFARSLNMDSRSHPYKIRLKNRKCQLKITLRTQSADMKHILVYEPQNQDMHHA
jgi:hypothetical protein